MTDEIKVEDADILTCKGIESTVLFDREIAGHILLLDYDGGYKPEELSERLQGLEGMTLLFRSSGNSYHVWNLTVRSKKETACKALELRSDSKHTQIGYNYGRWTLRVTPKKSNDGTTEKDAPELLEVAYNKTDKPQSHGHWRFAKAMFDVDADPPRNVEWFGDAYSVAKYMTVVDDLKQRHWEDTEDGEDG